MYHACWGDGGRQGGVLFECCVLALGMPVRVEEGRSRDVWPDFGVRVFGGFNWFVLFMLRIALSSLVVPVATRNK